MRYSYFILFVIITLLVLNDCQNEPYQQGKNLYASYCANCHMEDGSGLGANIPPLAQADYLADNQDKLACIIRNGLQETIVVNGITYDEPMLGVEGLSDFQVANIINYINQAWGNDYGFVTVENLRQQLNLCK